MTNEEIINRIKHIREQAEILHTYEVDDMWDDLIAALEEKPLAAVEATADYIVKNGISCWVIEVADFPGVDAQHGYTIPVIVTVPLPSRGGSHELP